MRKLQTRDVFSAARLIRQLGLKEDFKKMLEINNDSGKSPEEVGSEIVFLMLEKAAEKDCEDALYNFLAGPLEKTAGEVAEMALFALVDDVKKCADIENWKVFFGHVSALATK